MVLPGIAVRLLVTTEGLRGHVKKNGVETMEILEAFDKTGCAHSAAALAGCDPKMVRRLVARREPGLGADALIVRPRLVDGFTGVVEQLVAGSEGVIRADVAHEKLVACGYVGSERTTRRAVAAAKAGWRADHARSNRPWITLPGMWCQFDWGDGPTVWDLNGRLRSTVLFEVPPVPACRTRRGNAELSDWSGPAATTTPSFGPAGSTTTTPTSAEWSCGRVTPPSPGHLPTA